MSQVSCCQAGAAAVPVFSPLAQQRPCCQPLRANRVLHEQRRRLFDELARQWRYFSRENRRVETAARRFRRVSECYNRKSAVGVVQW